MSIIILNEITLLCFFSLSSYCSGLLTLSMYNFMSFVFLLIFEYDSFSTTAYSTFTIFYYFRLKLNLYVANITAFLHVVLQDAALHFFLIKFLLCHLLASQTVTLTMIQSIKHNSNLYPKAGGQSLDFNIRLSKCIKFQQLNNI